MTFGRTSLFTAIVGGRGGREGGEIDVSAMKRVSAVAQLQQRVRSAR